MRQGALEKQALLRVYEQMCLLWGWQIKILSFQGGLFCQLSSQGSFSWSAMYCFRDQTEENKNIAFCCVIV
jgi:hypothetical protein